MISARSRLIAAALEYLRAGRDVILRAHPAREATALRDIVLREAGAHAIECFNMDGSDEEAPIVRALPFGCVPAEVDRLMPPEIRPVILYDRTACFDRGVLREPKVRSVLA